MDREKNNYIPLRDATKFCNYSQEYLSLRARQGKLKAVKFGRNWVTKKEWLDEYLAGAEDYKKRYRQTEEIEVVEGTGEPEETKGPEKIEEPEETEESAEEPDDKVVEAPENLPVAPEEEPILKQAPLQVFVPGLRFVFILGLAVALLLGGIILGRGSFKNVYENLQIVFWAEQSQPPFPNLSLKITNFAEFMALETETAIINTRQYGRRAGYQLSAAAEGVADSLERVETIFGQILIEDVNLPATIDGVNPVRLKKLEREMQDMEQKLQELGEEIEELKAKDQGGLDIFLKKGKI